MLNAKILLRIIGNLLFIETGMFLLCLIVSLCYEESDALAFVFSALISAFIGVTCIYLGRHSGTQVSRRDAFFIVAITWIIFSFVGTIPMMLSGCTTNISDAFFEIMSGFTTTGCTILQNIDELSHGILFWRSLTHWIGGLGIIFFTLILLPSSGENNIRLFSAEATGLTHEKFHPHIRTTIQWLFTLYLIITAGCALCLWICGMNVFDAVNHAMSTTATGGFSTHTQGIQYFHSASIEYVEIFFMFISGVNFSLLYLSLQRKSFKILAHNGEFIFYLVCDMIVVAICMLSLIYFSNYTFLHALRAALFNVISLQTTTGFVSDNIYLWWHPVWFFLFFVMFMGACTGSTSGGIKSIRLLTILKTATSQFNRLLHPNACMPVRLENKIIPQAVEHALFAFVFWYIVLIVFGTLILTALGLSFFDSINLVLCNISNVGSASGLTLNQMFLPDVGKWICSFLMLAGRLEIFPILLPLTRAFWQNN